MKQPFVVLVTGATGAVGPRVVESLCKEGYRVRSLSMDDPPAGFFPSNVFDVRKGDITDRECVNAAMQGVDGVVHLAALLHIINPPPELCEQYERINVGGTKNVVEAALQSGVKRVVFFSTIAVYGASGGKLLAENSPLCPDSFYAQTKLDAEQVVLAAKRADGEPLGTVLRLGAVYGARIKGNYRRLLLGLAKGRFLPIGSGANRRTLVYDKDVARAAALALRHPGAEGSVFNITDGRCHSMNNIIETLCDALGRRPPRMSLPLGPIRFLAGAIEDAGQAFGIKTPILRATIDKYTEDVAVDGRKFCTQTGFVPKYNLAEGWRETVDEMKQAGEL